MGNPSTPSVSASGSLQGMTATFSGTPSGTGASCAEHSTYAEPSVAHIGAGVETPELVTQPKVPLVRVRCGHQARFVNFAVDCRSVGGLLV